MNIFETSCAPPHAFDVMLGSQLGIGAYRALVEEGLDAHMVLATLAAAVTISVAQ